jgi:hypothetical protein
MLPFPSQSLLYLRSEPLDGVHASDELGTEQNTCQCVCKRALLVFITVVITNKTFNCGKRGHPPLVH